MAIKYPTPVSTYLKLSGEKSRPMYQKVSNLLRLLVVWGNPCTIRCEINPVSMTPVKQANEKKVY